MPSFFYKLLRWCPGILGILLRQKMYRYLLKGCGRNVLIGRYVDLRNPGAILLGDGVILNDYACLDASRSSGREAAVILGDKVFIGASTSLTAGPGKLFIEEMSNIGSGCSIFATNGDLHLENHSLLAGFCTVGKEPAPEPEGITQSAGRKLSETHLGSGCWLGLRSQVLSGITVGEGTIVGAHSTVAESLPPYAIAFGQPAEVKRDRP